MQQCIEEKCLAVNASGDGPLGVDLEGRRDCLKSSSQRETIGIRSARVITLNR